MHHDSHGEKLTKKGGIQYSILVHFDGYSPKKTQKYHHADFSLVFSECLWTYFHIVLDCLIYA